MKLPTRAEVAAGAVSTARKAVTDLRREGNRRDSREVRMARRMLFAMRRRPRSTVYMGDSALSFVSASDQDARKLVRMVSDDLGGRREVVTMHGSSYHSSLYAEYVRLIVGTGARPVIVFPLCIRTHQLPWATHPKLSYREAVAFLRRLPSGVAPWRAHVAVPDAPRADFDEFYSTPFRTIAGERLIGEYVRPLKDPDRYGLPADEAVSLLYAYHHGGSLEPDTAPIETVTRLGEVVRASGLRAVVYETPVPIEYGTELWGPRFGAVTRSNQAVLRDAYRRGAGDDVVILRTGDVLGTTSFVDPLDGSEHMNEAGRTWLARQIVEAVRALGS